MIPEEIINIIYKKVFKLLTSNKSIILAVCVIKL